MARIEDDKPDNATANTPAHDRVMVYVSLSGNIDNITSGHKQTPSMTRREWQLLVAADPATQFEIKSASGTARAGAAIVKPGTPHSLNVEGCTIVRMTVNLVNRNLGALIYREGPATEPLPREWFSPFDALLADAAAGLPTLKTKALLQGTLAVLLAGQPTRPPLDPRVVRALETLALDHDLPFDALAQAAGMSLSRLSHLVSEHLGVSLRQFQAWLRMAQAWQYIVWNPEMSFTEIAHSLKFSDSSHLARAFRSCYGVSPTLFRDRRGAYVVLATKSTDPAIIKR